MRALLNWRYYVLLLLGLVSMVGVFGVPDEDSPTWFSDMMLSKVIGFGTGFVIYRLVLYWGKKKLISEFDEFTKDEEDDLWE